jgi:Xaa-Pro aminopeptidase
MKRIDQLRRHFPQWKVDGALVSTLVNIRYLSGFTGSNAYLWVGEKEARLFTDSRYSEQARAELKGSGCKVEIAPRSGPAVLERYKGQRIAVENQRITWQLYSALRKLGKLVHIDDALDVQRMKKDAAEIAAIRESVRVNALALRKVIRGFRVGQTEAEIAARIEYEQRKLGASGPAFPTIVAGGAHSALPHAQPRRLPVEAGGYLLIDMGACRDGYMSDLTRTFGVGKQVPQRQIDIYHAVLEAQLAAIDEIKPGVKAGEIHAAAVGVLKRRKLERYFTHSTGHGLGLEIHEAPRLGINEETLLESGMAITVEPGVYRPGLGGVRIEDTVLVTASGAEVLTPLTIAPKEWTIVG